MSIKRRKSPTCEVLAQRFVQNHRGRLLFVAGQWMEVARSGWNAIPNRKVNRMIRNSGWNSRVATSTRCQMEPTFAHSGPLPPVEITEPAHNVEVPPNLMVFIERHAGRLIYDQESTWWLKLSEHNPGRWLPLYDREVNRLIREIVGTLRVVRVRRDLEKSIWFAVKEMS